MGGLNGNLQGDCCAAHACTIDIYNGVRSEAFLIGIRWLSKFREIFFLVGDGRRPCRAFLVVYDGDYGFRRDSLGRRYRPPLVEIQVGIVSDAVWFTASTSTGCSIRERFLLSRFWAWLKRPGPPCYPGVA